MPDRLQTQIRNDREAVFRKLYQSCYPRVQRLLSRQGCRAEQMRDLFHDGLIIFYEKAVQGQLPPQASPEAYVLGICKHLWLRQREREMPQLPLTAFEQSLQLPAAYGQPLPKPKLRLFRFLEVAGRKCLDLLQAFYYQRTPLPRIAEEFGYQNTRSATVQKHKCLEKIRSEIRQKQLSYEEVVA